MKIQSIILDYHDISKCWFELSSIKNIQRMV